MSFHSPHLLWLLVPLVLLFSWDLARRVAHGATNFPKIVRAWAGAFDVSLGTRHSTGDTRPRIWLWFGLALCLVALARPQWGVIEEKVFDQSREVLIAVDLSRSMLAQDVKPSRLDRSKLLITSLLDGLKGERVGLVLFAGTAFLQSPLSADYEILREFLPALKPDYLPEGGSNYKAMLETSIQAFGTSTADRYLIILSDGESTDDGWKELGDGLKTKGIRVIGLGVGTAQGSFIPDGSGAFVKDERGAVVLSRLNSSSLQELAQLTGGAYTDASAWVDLSDLLKKTVDAGRKGDFSEKNTARKIERFQWFLAPGLLLLFLSFWAEFPVRPRERALPLGGKARNAERGARNAKNTTAPATKIAALVALLWLSAFSYPRSASAQPAPTAPTPATPSTPAPQNLEETFVAPLKQKIIELVSKEEITAKDYASFAETTINFGRRIIDTQLPEKPLEDGLKAVAAGEELDKKAADWPKLRQELENLLKQRPQPPEQKDQQQKQDQKQDQQQKQDQKNQQNKDQQDQKNQDQQQQQQDQQQSDQQKQQQEQQQKQQDAFGDMKEQKDQPKPDEQKEPQAKPQPQPQTQKVGGQKEKKLEVPTEPELAMPLQKLEQVRNQDSPAKLQQLMQGRPAPAPKKGKDW